VPSRVLTLLAPPLCAVCRGSCEWRNAVCTRCELEVAASPGGPLLVAGADRAWAAAAYDGAPRRLVAALKFGKRLSLAQVAADAIADSLPADWPPGTLVPVAADPVRHRLRGFDPAGEIAKALGRRLGVRVLPSLTRSHAPRQVGRSRPDRLAGPTVRARGDVPPVVTLLDDVVTTGSTLAACAAALRVAGGREVLALAFARA
jgi:predicted amidophosphoribosyltransferase